MIDLMQPDAHPDSDLLNAFIEGALTEHERLECVSHIAECKRCRNIVFLAQPPQTLPAVVTLKGPWYLQFRALGGALAACLVIVVFSLYKFQPAEPKLSTKRVEVAGPAAKPRSAAPLSAPVKDAARNVELSTANAKPGLKSRSSHTVAVKSAEVESAKVAVPAPGDSPIIGGVIGGLPSPYTPQATKSQPDATAQNVLPLSAHDEVSLPALPRISLANSSSSSEIKGSVTDPAGDPISGATVTVRALSGAAHERTKTDSLGQFLMAGLPPGKYGVQIESTGFVTSSSQIELGPKDLSMLAVILNVGSVAQSVEVAAASPNITSEADAIRSETLSGKRPFANTVSSGTRIIAIDAAGTLYFNHKERKRWKAIKPKWQGKVAQIAVISSETAPRFQLTTDSGALWFSSDGTHWQPKKN